MTPMSLRDQIRKLLQLHTHPDSRAEILACFDEMSGEPTQQQVARWCEEIRGFQRAAVDRTRRPRNVRAANRGLVILERLGMVTIHESPTSLFEADDEFSLSLSGAADGKVNP